VGDYIKKRTKDAQFIIISLRNNMFDLADKLVGVYKTFDQTKVINLAAGKLLAKKQIMNEEKKEK
jgi:structural maintenance of chromosome 4